MSDETAHQRPVMRRQSSATRLARRAAASTLLGALVITGPWTVPAAGHEARVLEPRALRVPGHPHDRSHDPADGFEALAYDYLLPGSSASALAAGTRTSPITGYPVSAAYGIPGGWAAGYHTGVDFATPVGTPVSSVGPGTVLHAGDTGDYGTAVVIEMDDGYYALYAHLSRTDVQDGERVTAGTRIGETGNTGRTTGPHLHFEVRSGPGYGSDVDPLAYLARHGVSVI